MNRLRIARALGRARWIRRGLRERVVGALLPHEASPDLRFEVRLHGYRFAGRLGNWIERNVYLFDGYEEEIQTLIGHLGRSGGCGVFVDVGANVGLHTLYASTRFERVHAFEPYPPLRDRLATLLHANRVENVEVHGVAVGTRCAELPFFAPPSSNLGSGSFVRGHSALNTPYGTLPVVDGDEYFSARIGPVQTLKIDVEGYEMEVLRGLRGTLERWRPDLIVELTDETRRQVKDLSGLLHMLPGDYRIFDIRGRQVYWWLFERARLGLVRVRELEPGVSGNCLMIPADRLPALRAAGLTID